MKFRRYFRDEGYTMSNRKIAAFLRKQKNERERYPLFSDHVASEQISLEEETILREQERSASIRDFRNFRAQQWRRGRAAYFAQPEHIKAAIRQKWNSENYPLDPAYFCSLVDVASGEQARRLAAIAIEDAKIRERVRAQLEAESARLV